MNEFNAATAASTNGSGANAVGDVLRELPLECLKPSNTKVQAERRARFDAKALRELTATVKERGVIEPILVRLIESESTPAYEIVAGERRWCASRAAGRATIPSIVRPLTDAEVLSLQLIENIQREALHALDEAEGFGTLLQDSRYTVERIVAEIGKPKAYVYQRLKLLTLCPTARRAFNKGKLVLETAFLLARIPTEDLQRQALKDITERADGCEPMSPRAAARHIQAKYMLRLADASFPTADGTLVATAGPCGSCPKRTGSQPELFRDVQGADVCTDPSCFQAKRAAWTARQLAAAKSAGRTVIEGPAAKKIAPYSIHHLEGHVRPTDRCYDDPKQRTYRELLGDALKPALLVAPNTGDLIEVVDRRELAPLLKARGVGLRPKKADDSERARRVKVQRESAFRAALLEAVRRKSPATLGRAELEELALTVFTHHGYESRKRLLKLWGWVSKNGHAHESLQHDATARARIPKLTDAELARFLLDCVFVAELQVSAWSPNDRPDRLLAAAKRLRIDVDALRKVIPTDAKKKPTPGVQSAHGKRPHAAARPKRKAA